MKTFCKWDILFFIATGFLFLGYWVDGRLYALAGLLFVVGVLGLFGVKKGLFSSCGLLCMMSCLWVLATFVVPDKIDKIIAIAGSDEVMIKIGMIIEFFVFLGMIIGFFVFAVYIGKKDWMLVTYFLLPEATLWSQLELLDPSDTVVSEVVPFGASGMVAIFIIGSIITLFLKSKLKFFCLLSLVIICNTFNCYVQAQAWQAWRSPPWSFWGHFSFVTLCTVGFGLIVISVPKAIDFYKKRTVSINIR